MRTTMKPYKGLNIGFFITFAITKQPNFYTVCNETSPLFFRTSVYFPENKKEQWFTMFVEAIIQLQKGRSCPLRMNADNALEFFSMKELEKLDRILTNIPVNLYNFQEAAVPRIQKETSAFADIIEKQDSHSADKTYSIFLLNDTGWIAHKPYQSLDSAKDGARRIFNDGVWRAVAVVDKRARCPVFTLGNPQLTKY